MTESHHPRYLGYMRVSTDDQKNSLEIQREKYANFLRAKGVEAYSVGILQDEDVSGSTHLLSRENGQWILHYLTRGDFLVVASLDRAFRSAADCEKTLDQLKIAGISLVVLDIGLDCGTPEGQLMAGVMSCFARFERQTIHKRVTSGRFAARRRQDFPVGPMLFGWKKDRRGTIIPNTQERELAAWIAMLVRNGATCNTVFATRDRIAERFGLPTWNCIRWGAVMAAFHLMDWPRLSKAEIISAFPEWGFSQWKFVYKCTKDPEYREQCKRDLEALRSRILDGSVVFWKGKFVQPTGVFT